MCRYVFVYLHPTAYTYTYPCILHNILYLTKYTLYININFNLVCILIRKNYFCKLVYIFISERSTYIAYIIRLYRIPNFLIFQNSLDFNNVSILCIFIKKNSKKFYNHSNSIHNLISKIFFSQYNQICKTKNTVS